MTGRVRDSFVTVKRIEDVLRIGPGVNRVVLLQDGKPAKTLLRQKVGDVSVSYELGSRWESGVRFLKPALLMNGSLIGGDIVVEGNVVLSNSKVTGSGIITANSVIVDRNYHGSSRDTRIPFN
jgi:hypothetical protein